MKITTKPQSFAPCSITFEFENKEELDAFGALFNWTPTMAAIEKMTGMKNIYEQFISIGADVSAKIDELSILVNKHPALKTNSQRKW